MTNWHLASYFLTRNPNFHWFYSQKKSDIWPKNQLKLSWVWPWLMVNAYSKGVIWIWVRGWENCSAHQRTNDTIIDINSNLVTLQTNVILQIVDIGNRTALFHFQTRLSEGIVLQQTRQHWLACDVWQISSKSERILSIKRTIHRT